MIDQILFLYPGLSLKLLVYVSSCLLHTSEVPQAPCTHTAMIIKPTAPSFHRPVFLDVLWPRSDTGESPSWFLFLHPGCSITLQILSDLASSQFSNLCSPSLTTLIWFRPYTSFSENSFLLGPQILSSCWKRPSWNINKTISLLCLKSFGHLQDKVRVIIISLVFIEFYYILGAGPGLGTLTLNKK